MILDDIIAKRKEQLEREKQAVSLEIVKKQAYGTKSDARRFYNALNTEKIAVIAEVKKASPSKGIIKADSDPVEIAKAYERSGANAISVLTEEYYFKGSSDYLREIRQAVSIPILRKDFIIDEYQIYESRLICADAILLIAAILDKKTIIEYLAMAEDLNLDCLVEVHDKRELDLALDCNAEIIGINNRNLKTFDVSLNTTIDLISHIPDNCIVVSESGITTNADMRILKKVGANAVLIGETLMRSENIDKTLNDLRCDV